MAIPHSWLGKYDDEEKKYEDVVPFILVIFLFYPKVCEVWVAHIFFLTRTWVKMSWGTKNFFFFEESKINISYARDVNNTNPKYEG